jgi:hypothetical protein
MVKDKENWIRISIMYYKATRDMTQDKNIWKHDERCKENWIHNARQEPLET